MHKASFSYPIIFNTINATEPIKKNHVINLLTALFNNKKFMNKRVKITGWYRRSPVPYVEIKQIEYEGDGTVDKMKSFAVNKFITWFFLIGSVALIVLNIIG